MIEEIIDPGQYLWLTPSGETATLNAEAVEVLARVERVFPGARAIWWRCRGEWRRP